MDPILVQSRATLANTPIAWTALAAVDSAGLLARRPAVGEWSALQCLQHVVDTEHAVFRARVVSILEGRDIVAYNPDIEGNVDRIIRSARGLAADLQPMRAASLAVLDGIGDEDLEKTARHRELGRVTLRELLNEWAAHDLMHLVQAERALMQAFIPGSGPWRGYFADHDLAVAPTAMQSS
jgi:hypothetical protein